MHPSYYSAKRLAFPLQYHSFSSSYLTNTLRLSLHIEVFLPINNSLLCFILTRYTTKGCAFCICFILNCYNSVNLSTYQEHYMGIARVTNIRIKLFLLILCLATIYACSSIKQNVLISLRQRLRKALRIITIWFTSSFRYHFNVLNKSFRALRHKKILTFKILSLIKYKI